MHINIRASENQKAILLSKKIDSSIEIIWFENNLVEADAYIDLLFEDEEPVFNSVKNKLVIVNSVIKVCSDLPNNYCRINGWNTFLDKEKLEAATLNDELKTTFENILNKLGYECWFVSDIVGMIAARPIAMIINEAYFGLEDEISTKEQIDTAMKLGTNYPFGPFEWAEKIGLKNVLNLLNELYKTDERYKPCSLLIDEYTNTKSSN